MYDKANYFAVLPAAVRYDANITARTVLLYATLTSLARGNSEAYAGNRYLADVLGTSERTAMRLLSELEAQKYITIRYEYKNGTKEIARRVIQIESLPPLMALSKEQSLYAVIPSHILAMTELSVQAKLLYAEISAATPTDGFCSKPATFFAELLHASEPTVRRWIKELCDVDAVRVEMEYKGETREIRRRRIYLTEAAAIAEKRAEIGQIPLEDSLSGNPSNLSQTLNSPNCGQNRGMLIFVTTSEKGSAQATRLRKIRRKRKKATEILRL